MRDAESNESVVVAGGEKKMEGVASITLLPNGSISGHFIQLPDSICYGLHGTGTFYSQSCTLPCLQNLLLNVGSSSFTGY